MRIKLAALSLLVACSSASNGAAPAGPTTSTGGTVPSGAIPCEVQAILEKSCQGCHAAEPLYGAPMPLVTLADFYRTAGSGRRVWEDIPTRIANDADPMPPAPNPRLSNADRDVLGIWLAGGPQPSHDSSETCSTPPDTKPPVVDLSCKTDLELAPASAYTMQAATGDEYVCYGVDVNRATPTHVVGFAPRIQNPKIVHHVVLFESDASYTTTPTKCSAAGSLQWRMVMAWAPGGKGLDMPAEAGFPLKTGADSTHYIVQVHYSNPQALEGETDTSGFSLCTAPPRANEADVVAFGTQSIAIPPGGYSRTCSSTLSSQMANLHFVAAMPHMHKLGTSMQTTIARPGESGGDLGHISSFSFDTQAWQPIDKSIVTHEGDVVTTTCAWQNPTGNTVKFGENTADEMCYSFTVYYPKVTGGLWSWALPAVTSSCQ